MERYAAQTPKVLKGNSFDIASKKIRWLGALAPTHKVVASGDTMCGGMGDVSRPTIFTLIEIDRCVSSSGRAGYI